MIGNDGADTDAADGRDGFSTSFSGVREIRIVRVRALSRNTKVRPYGERASLGAVRG